MTVIAASGETRVNTTIDGIQDWSSVAALKDGGWVVTWGSRNLDGTPKGIFQQRYDAKGLVIGGEVQVNCFSPGNELREVSTTGLSDGGWVVTWIGEDGAGDGIFQQRYNIYGLKVGHETRVNTTTANSQTEPAVTALAGGGWIVTWSSYETAHGYLIHQQRYGANGFPIGTETTVDSYRYDAYRPAVTALSDGGWLVTYQGYGPEADLDLDVFQQRYDADGWTVDLPIRVNTSLEDPQGLSTVTGLKDGGWVVTWTSVTGDSSGYGIRQQRFAVNGQKVGTETLVNTATVSDQFDSSVTALADGGWLVTWTSGPFTNVPDAPVDIYLQRYAANGQRVGNETRVNTFTANDQSLASVTVLKDGGWVVTWKSFAQDGDHYDVYQQRFTAAGIKIGPTTPTDLTLSAQPVKEGASGTTLVGLSLPRRSSRKASPIRS